MRRDFVECAAGQVRLTHWCQGWIGRIASIYRLNEARLEHYDPGRTRQTPAFGAAQTALKKALDGLFARANEELAGLPDEAREGTIKRDTPDGPIELNVESHAVFAVARKLLIALWRFSESGLWVRRQARLTQRPHCSSPAGRGRRWAGW